MNVIVETFMSEYFRIAAVIGKYLTDRKKLFVALGKIFLIPEAHTDELHNLAENETARKINSDKDFMLHLRMRKYLKLIGVRQETNVEREDIACLKGSAILDAQGQKLVFGPEVSRNMVHTCLTSSALSGSVTAMRIMGILQCEGIFFGKNVKDGIKHLSRAADWNDYKSILALLYFGKDNRQTNMSRLYSIVKDTPFADIYDRATKRYETEEKICVDEVELLNKAFGEGVLNRDTYEPYCARILNGNLHIKDKEKSIFSQNKEQISIICDLPLKLSSANITSISTETIGETTINREAEITTIKSLLARADFRELPGYRPLCVCSDSIYLLNMYAKVISSESKSVHTERIEVAELTEYDTSSTPNNIFVRNIEEDKDNRFLLFFCGEIHKMKIDAIKSILQSERRVKFHLNAPMLTLNLGAVLPVCFCDKRNAETLKPYCDMVVLAPLTTDELSAAVRHIFADKEKLYGVEIKLSGNAEEIFDDCDIDSAEKLIDTAVRANMKEGAITLTNDVLQKYKPTNDKPRMGFGGFTYGRSN